MNEINCHHLLMYRNCFSCGVPQDPRALSCWGCEKRIREKFDCTTNPECIRQEKLREKGIIEGEY